MMKNTHIPVLGKVHLALFALLISVWGEAQIAPKIQFQVADSVMLLLPHTLTGYLGTRVQLNEHKRLLKVDSAVILSGFRSRPGSQTWIGEHMGKYLHAASLTYRYYHNKELLLRTQRMLRTYLQC